MPRFRSLQAAIILVLFLTSTSTAEFNNPSPLTTYQSDSLRGSGEAMTTATSGTTTRVSVAASPGAVGGGLVTTTTLVGVGEAQAARRVARTTEVSLRRIGFGGVGVCTCVGDDVPYRLVEITQAAVCSHLRGDYNRIRVALLRKRTRISRRAGLPQTEQGLLGRRGARSSNDWLFP